MNRRAVTSNFHHTSSVSSMMNHVGWQQLDACRDNSPLCLLFKILYNLTCLQLKFNITSHIITSPQQQNPLEDFMQMVFLFHLRCQYIMYSFGANAWNNLPSHTVFILGFLRWRGIRNVEDDHWKVYYTELVVQPSLNWEVKKKKGHHNNECWICIG